MFKLNYFALEILIRVGLRNATQNLGTLITTLRLESGWNIPQNHPHVGGRKKKWSGNIARWLVLENEIPKKVQQCDLQMDSRTPKADGSVQLAIQAKCCPKRETKSLLTLRLEKQNKTLDDQELTRRAAAGVFFEMCLAERSTWWQKIHLNILPAQTTSK